MMSMSPRTTQGVAPDTTTTSTSTTPQDAATKQSIRRIMAQLKAIATAAARQRKQAIAAPLPPSPAAGSPMALVKARTVSRSPTPAKPNTGRSPHLPPRSPATRRQGRVYAPGTPPTSASASASLASVSGLVDVMKSPSPSQDRHGGSSAVVAISIGDSQTLIAAAAGSSILPPRPPSSAGGAAAAAGAGEVPPSLDSMNLIPLLPESRVPLGTVVHNASDHPHDSSGGDDDDSDAMPSECDDAAEQDGFDITRCADSDRQDTTFSISHTAYPVADEETGEVELLNDIVFFGELGRGAYGRVIHGVCDRYDFELAVKEVPRRLLVPTQELTRVALPDGSVTSVKLAAEVRAMARLRHPCIVPILELIDDPSVDSVYMVMPKIRGKQVGTTSTSSTTSDVDFGDQGVLRCTTVSDTVLRAVATDVVSALCYCQQNHIVHGDIKPENILLEETSRLSESGCGAGVRAKLADFGVSAALHGGEWRFTDARSQAAAEEADPNSDDEPQSRHSSPAGGMRPLDAAALVDAAGSGRLGSDPQTEGNLPTPVRVLDHESDHALDVDPSTGNLGDMFERIAPLIAVQPPKPAGAMNVAHASFMSPPSDDPLARTAAPAPAGHGVPLSTTAELAEQKEQTPVEQSPDATPLPSRGARPGRAFGTPAFLAPELVSGAASQPTPASDAWALGVTLFGLRYGRLPFGGSSRAALQQAIVEDEPRFPPAPVGDRDARRWRLFIKALLVKDPSTRLTVAEAAHAAVLTGPRDVDIK